MQYDEALKRGHAPQPPGHAPAGGHAPCDHNLALFEEELAARPRVPALLRRIAAYSSLGPDSELGPGPRRALGTLCGVATPSLQTLLGLVLVLRLPWAVGSGGVLQVCGVGVLLGACAVLTALSLSAIATNGGAPGGGPLALLWGALGPEAGGAVGLCAFLGAAFGAASAALGAAELLLPPGGHLQPCPTPRRGDNGSAAPLPAVPGPSARLLARNLWPPEPPLGDTAATFGLLLGLSLPTASGVLWGCSHAGELRDAAHSIPADLSAALLLGACVEGQLLRDKFGSSLRGRPVLAALSWPSPWLPLAGALLAAGGAGLQALAGGSRLLRGLARARALPLPPALGRGELWPLAVTAAVAELGVLLGSIDLVAPVLSVFSLTAYLCLNLACAMQGLLTAPGWNPRCRLYHWAVSLAGAGLCLALMFATCWFYALPALGMAGMAYTYADLQGAPSEWGEGFRSLPLSAALAALRHLEQRPPRRPQLLVLLKLDAELRVTQPQLLALAAQLRAAGGLTVAASVLPGDVLQARERVRAAEQALRGALAGARCGGFVQVLAAGRAREGLAALVQGCGLGALRPDTVLLGWPRGWRRRDDPAAARDFVELLRVAAAGGRALLVAKGPLGTGAPGGSLDVWWVVGDGRLLTLLPLLLRQHPAWRGCPLRLFAVALLEDNSLALGRLLQAFAQRLRLPARTEVVELHDSDVSAYTYERTLMMEQRSRMLRQMRLARQAWHGSAPPSGGEEEEGGGGGGPRPGPSPTNVRRMHAAERLNEAMGRRSAGARLVLLDLPAPPPASPRPRDDNYVEFLEVLTEGAGPRAARAGRRLAQYGPV
ncbi:solute carrier family 12 member 4-like [Cygnus atratus]|uniref:solute carrier family 12 member 4-like n=1 Tax=Cygnus atratus TaxID=8868 RepID=UPI0021B769D3|nr:solute carrier family 12 member 4-like [Cygnus atratus]